MSAGAGGCGRHDPLELLDGVEPVTARFEGQRKIVVGILRVWTQSQRDFVGPQRERRVALFKSSKPKVVVGIVEGRIVANRRLVVGNRLRPIATSLGTQTAFEIFVRLSPVA